MKFYELFLRFSFFSSNNDDVERRKYIFSKVSTLNLVTIRYFKEISLLKKKEGKNNFKDLDLSIMAV